jgi:hypothetical protein
MTAITFNGIADAKYGTVDLSRVYCGSTLVWTQAIGLPFATSFPSTPPAGTVWPVLQGTWRSAIIGGQSGIIGFSGVASIAEHATIRAANVSMTARVTVAGAGSYIGLLARANGTTYYAGEYADIPQAGITPGFSVIRVVKVIAGARTVLGSWQTSQATTTNFSFSAIGSTLTVARGAFVHSVTDSSLTYGSIGIEATSGDGFNSLTATNPTRSDDFPTEPEE